MTVSGKKMLSCLILSCPIAAFLFYYFELQSSSAPFFSGIFFILYYLLSSPPEKKELPLLVPSVLFSLGRIIGFSYDRFNSYTLIMKNGIRLLMASGAVLSLSILAFSVFLILFRFLSQSSTDILISRSKSSLFFIYFLILFAGSLPYLYIYYPGLNIFDTHDQILQFFGYPSYIGDGQYLSDHHPVLLTVIYGLFIRFGLFLGSANLGQLLYSIVSLVLLSAVLSWTFLSFTTLGLSWKIPLFTSIFWALWPVPALYAFNMCKDVTVAPFLLLYAHQMLHIWQTDGKWIKNTRNCLFLFLVLLIMMMMRKSAFYAILLAGLCLLISYKSCRKKMLIVYGSALLSFIFYSSLLLPALHVLPGESREMLSVPFQMTARYLNTYPEDVTPEEKEALSQVLDMESISSYDPRLSDPIKDSSKDTLSFSTFRSYIKAWFSMGIRHPGVYLDAFLNLTYGYFYPSGSNTIVCVTLSSPDRDSLVFEQNPSLDETRLSLFNLIYYTLRRLPGIGMLFYVDTITWAFLLLFISLYIMAGVKAASPFVYFLAYGLIALLSPKSGEIRYILPMFYALPVLFLSVKLAAKKGYKK